MCVSTFSEVCEYKEDIWKRNSPRPPFPQTFSNSCMYRLWKIVLLISVTLREEGAKEIVANNSILFHVKQYNKYPTRNHQTVPTMIFSSTTLFIEKQVLSERATCAVGEQEKPAAFSKWLTFLQSLVLLWLGSPGNKEPSKGLVSLTRPFRVTRSKLLNTTPNSPPRGFSFKYKGIFIWHPLGPHLSLWQSTSA